MAGNPLFTQINIRGMVDVWARYTISKWRAELRKKKIGVSDELYRSFTHQLQRDSEALTGVLLQFKYYGRFRDMGVGKGVKAFERGNNTANMRAARQYGATVDYVGRKPANWLNKIKAGQTHRLREILAEEASKTVATSVGKILNTSSGIKIEIHG